MAPAPRGSHRRQPDAQASPRRPETSTTKPLHVPSDAGVGGRHDHDALSLRAHPDAMWLTIGSGYASLIRTDSPEQAIPRHSRAPIVEQCLSAVVGPPAHVRYLAYTQQRYGWRIVAIPQDALQDGAVVTPRPPASLPLPYVVTPPVRADGPCANSRRSRRGLHGR
jgi:hypothetical protein